MSKNVKNVTMETRKMTQAQFESLKVPKATKANIYKFAEALKTSYLAGKKVELTLPEALKLGISPVEYKAYLIECEKLYALCVEYIHAKHEGNDVASATKKRSEVAKASKLLLNRFFVKDKEGLYEFNNNDIENVIFCCELWEKSGYNFDKKLTMDTRKRATCVNSHKFMCNLTELMLFKLFGEGVLSTERSEGLSQYKEVCKKAKEIQKIIRKNDDAIKGLQEEKMELETEEGELDFEAKEIIAYIELKVKRLTQANSGLKAEYEEEYKKVQEAYVEFMKIK